MRLYPQPGVADSRPRKGPVVASGTLSPAPKYLLIRMFGWLRGTQNRPYTLVPYTQGASGLTGFGSEQNG